MRRTGLTRLGQTRRARYEHTYDVYPAGSKKPVFRCLELGALLAERQAGADVDGIANAAFDV